MILSKKCAQDETLNASIMFNHERSLRVLTKYKNISKYERSVNNAGESVTKSNSLSPEKLSAIPSGCTDLTVLVHLTNKKSNAQHNHCENDIFNNFGESGTGTVTNMFHSNEYQKTDHNFTNETKLPNTKRHKRTTTTHIHNKIISSSRLHFRRQVLPVCLLVAFFVILLSNTPRTVSAKRGSRGPKWWSLPAVVNASDLQSNMVHSNSLAGRYLSLPVHKRLKKKQKRLVEENQGLMAAVVRSVRAAEAECRHQFRDEKWNCPVPPLKRRKRHYFGKIVNKQCPETSFLYALTSLTLLQEVTKACTEGTIQSCTCSYPANRNMLTQSTSSNEYYSNYRSLSTQSTASPEVGWEWGGCSDDVAFGLAVAARFTDAGEKIRDVASLVNLHNNKLGRLIGSSNLQLDCKCHGLSGSCAVKTCWQRLPKLRTVTTKLKELYDNAKLVRASEAMIRDFNSRRSKSFRRRSNNRRSSVSKQKKKKKTRGSGSDVVSNNVKRRVPPLNAHHRVTLPPVENKNFISVDTDISLQKKRKKRNRKLQSTTKPSRSGVRPIYIHDLIYLHESPDFCEKNKEYNIPGTSGRECNSREHCQHMCCGRPYRQRSMMVQERCDCTFQWCCDVRCNICNVTKVINTCV